MAGRPELRIGGVARLDARSEANALQRRNELDGSSQTFERGFASSELSRSGRGSRAAFRGFSPRFGQPPVEVVIVGLAVERRRRQRPYDRIRGEAQGFQNPACRREIVLRKRVHQLVKCFSTCHVHSS